MPIDGRPGASLEPYDFEAAAKELRKTYGERAIREVDVELVLRERRQPQRRGRRRPAARCARVARDARALRGPAR